ncbi:metallophosphoesterase [Actinoplanes sp. NPDC051475]|uniref:metallophosphoesterase n=1 Tax=Actinoplanes sp. NPDC051475 TaxID=3157225 RepID=UPI00344DE92C
MFGFVGLIFLVIGLIHLYLWKRLIHDPLRRGALHRLGGIAAVLLALLIPATLIGTRTGYAKWLAWPGYVWLALMFYLLVILGALEIPRLLAALWIRARAEQTSAAAAELEVGTPTPRSAADVEVGTPTRVVSAPTAGVGAPTGKVSTQAETTTEAAHGTATANPPHTGTTTGAHNGTATASPASTGTAAEAHNGTTTAAGAHNGTTTASPASTGTTAEARDGTTTANPPRTSTTAQADESNTPTNPPGIDRRLLLARGAAIFAGLTAAGITGYGVKTATGGPRLDRVQLPLAKLPPAMDGTRLAVVSDIHLGPLTGVAHTQRIVDLINSVDADIVCVVGDLVDGSVAELGKSAAPLAGIKSRRGAYFVTGNHEYYSGFQEWVVEVERLGVRPLRNERLEIDGLDLAGVNDLGGADVGDAPDFERALGDRDPARPVVLMAHQPVAAREAAPYGVDLQVSGHTHGGQMVPFNLLVRLQQPVVSGFGEVDGVPVYVTNGAGFWGPPVRVGAPPQVSVIDLRAP